MLSSQGKDLGYITVSQHPSAEGLITEIESLNRLKRDGQQVNTGWSGKFLENPKTGKPLTFEHRYHWADQEQSRSRGRVDAVRQKLALADLNNRSVASDTGLQADIQSARFLFPVGSGINHVFKAHYNDTVGSRFAYQTLDLGVYPQLVNVQARLAGKEELLTAFDSQAAAQKPVRVRKFEIQNPANPDSLVYEWRNAQGKLIKASSGDESMLMMAAAPERMWDASAEMAGEMTGLDSVLDTRISSSPIRYPRQTTKAMYRLTPIRNANASMLSVFDNDDRQTVLIEGDGQVETGAIRLQVKDTIPAFTGNQLPVRGTPADLSASSYIQSNDPAMVNLVRQLSGTENRAYFLALRFKNWVHANIANKTLDVGFASASETLQSRSGDCTEHAVLLAAMARAAGIPARVAVGLIYLPQDGTELGQFVYHMWTEINIGPDTRKPDTVGKSQWVALDATQVEDIVDATHLKIGHSSLSNTSELMALTSRVASLVGHVRIDVLSAISPNGSTVDLTGQVQKNAIEIPKVDIQSVDLQTLNQGKIENYTITPPPASLSLDTLDGLFADGTQKLKADQYHTAMRSFEQAMNKAKTPMQAIKLGKRLMALELYPLAHRAFMKAGELDASVAEGLNQWLESFFPAKKLTPDLEAFYIAAVNQEQRGQWPEAQQAFEGFTRQVPDYAPVYLHLGSIAMGLGDTQEALSAYRRYTSLAPRDSRGYERLGEVYLSNAYLSHSQNATQAASYFSQALQLAQMQPDSFSDAPPTVIAAKLKIAQAQMQLNNSPKSASAWTLMGDGYRDSQDLERARDAYQNALKSNPNAINAVLGLWEMDMAKSDWQSAAKRAAVAARWGGNARAMRLKGYYHMRRRQYPVALGSLKQAIRLAPADSEAYGLLAQVYQRMAELENNSSYLGQARQALRSGIQNTISLSQRAVLKRQFIQMVLVNPNRSEGELNQALEDVESLLKTSPLKADEDVHSLVLKGRLLIEAQQYAEAELVLKSALALDNYRSEALSAMGYLSQLEGSPQQAIAYYQQALKHEPEDVIARNGLNMLISEQKLALKRPEKALVLSDDERDYLYFYRDNYIELIKQQLVMFEKLAPLMVDVGWLTVRANQHREAMGPVLNQAYVSMKQSYESIKAQKPPARMAKYHFYYTQAAYSALEVIRLMAQTYPTMLFRTDAAKRMRQQQEMKRLGDNLRVASELETKAFAALSLPRSVQQELSEIQEWAVRFATQTKQHQALIQESQTRYEKQTGQQLLEVK